MASREFIGFFDKWLMYMKVVRGVGKLNFRDQCRRVSLGDVGKVRVTVYGLMDMIND